jgi:hypothetical protein
MLLYERLLRTVGSPFKAVGRLLQNITHFGTAKCAVLGLRHNTTYVLGEVIDENRDKIITGRGTTRKTTIIAQENTTVLKQFLIIIQFN